jgi:hypothetical protein
MCIRWGGNVPIRSNTSETNSFAMMTFGANGIILLTQRDSLNRNVQVIIEPFLRGIGRGFYPLPPTPPGMRVRTGRLPRVSNRSRTNQSKANQVD